MNTTATTLTVHSATAALQDVLASTGVRWPLSRSCSVDLTTRVGAWSMLADGYYDQAGIPASREIRRMLTSHIVDAAAAAGSDRQRVISAKDRAAVYQAVRALPNAIEATAVEDLLAEA